MFKLDGKRLAQGLLNATGDDLRLVYALVMETKLYDLLLAKAKDVMTKDLNHFEQNLQAEIQRLHQYPDEQLQLQLFLYMLEQLEIKGAHYNLLTEIEYACTQIVEKAHALQLKQDKQYKQFAEKRDEQPSVSLVLYQMQKIFESFDQSQTDLDDETTENLIQQIEAYIQSLPLEKQRQIKEKLNIDELTNSTIKQLIATQGTAVLMAIIVEVAGFAAFTTLTSTIATTAGLLGVTLPFGAYMFATSALSILTGPVGLALIAVGGGALINYQNKKVRKAFIPIGIVQLLLPAVIEEKQPVQVEHFIQGWQKLYDKQQKILQEIATYEMTKQQQQAKKDAFEEQMRLQTDQHAKKRAMLTNKLAAIEKCSDLIAVHEKSPAYIQLTSEMANILQTMNKKRSEIEANRKQAGLWNTVKNTFANQSIASQLKELNEKYGLKEQLRTEEVVKMKPQQLKAQCISAEVYQFELDKLQKEIQITRTSIQQTKDAISTTERQIQQVKGECKKHQKKWYGLEHIV